MQGNPIVWDNLGLVSIVVAYIAAVYLAHSLLEIRGRFILLFYSGSFTRLSIIFTGCFVLFHIWKKSYRILFTWRYLTGFLTVYVLMPMFKSAFASYKQTIPLVQAFTWDPALMNLDYTIHFGHHPWRLLESLLDFPLIMRAIDSAYMGWFYLLFLSCLWMAWTPRRDLRLRYLISTLLVWILVGSVLATVFSSAGPCFYSTVVSDSQDPFAPLMQRLWEISESGRGNYLYAVFNQAGLLEGQITNSWGPFGGISAMPSLHLAMATLFALLAFEIRKWLGWVFVGYAALIQIGSVILGWHYASDGYAGIILAALIWYAVKRFIPHPDKAR